MISVLRNTGIQIRHTFYEDGVAIAADGSVTYTVVKADGTTLTSGTATHVASPSDYYKFDLAPQANLNLLTITWSGVFGGLTQSQTDQVEIVGGIYCTLAELRALPGLSNATTFPDATLLELRREFEDIAERWCGVAFVPRFARETYVAVNCPILLNRPQARTVLAASSTDSAGAVTTYTTTAWRVSPVSMILTLDAVYGDVTVEYEHGLDAPPPQIARASKIYVRNRALQDAKSVGRDVLRQVDENGFQIQFSTPDWDAGRPTGLLEVDAALNSVGRIPTCA